MANGWLFYIFSEYVDIRSACTLSAPCLYYIPVKDHPEKKGERHLFLLSAKPLKAATPILNL